MGIRNNTIYFRLGTCSLGSSSALPLFFKYFSVTFMLRKNNFPHRPCATHLFLKYRTKKKKKLSSQLEIINTI